MIEDYRGYILFVRATAEYTTLDEDSVKEIKSHRDIYHAQPANQFHMIFRFRAFI